MILKSDNKYLFSVVGLSLLTSGLLYADINGTIFRDYNLNGLKDALEVGVSEVNVTAYGDSGVVSQAITDSSGNYNLTTGVGKYRVEIGDIPSYLQVGTAINGTTHALSSISTDGTTHNIGLNNPADYAESNPNIVVTRMVKGAYNGANKNKDVLLKYSYLNSNGTDAPTTIATFGQLGSVYGVAHLKRANITYASSYFKRHIGMGFAGVGAIYSVDNSLNSSSTFDTLSGTNPRNADASYDWNHDIDGYAKVGKIGVGDIELSDDETTLFAVNMYDKKLYAYGLKLDGSQASKQSYVIPSPCANPLDFRPMALGFNDGILYTGVTCTAESTVNADDSDESSTGVRRGDKSKLSAHIYSFNPVTATFNNTPVLNIDLTYGRGCIYTSDVNDINSTNSCTYVDKDGITQPYLANWNPWQMDYNIVFNDKKPGNIGNQDGWIEYPQPILSDIAFDNDDSMILSIRDINGDRTGNESFSPNIEDNTTRNGNGEGDILRACGNLKLGWTLENNGTCGGISTGGANNHEGLGGGEYYWYDNGIGGHGSIDESITKGHSESVMGGILQIAGYPDFVVSAMDVHGIKDNGLIWLRNDTGEISKDSTNIVKRLKISDDNANVTFGKASGLGDIELLSTASPLEIGDYVWDDNNSNGIQEPSELPLAGVEVKLYRGITLVGIATTNSEGHYYFGGTSNSNMVGGSRLRTYMNYTLKIDLSSAVLDGKIVTQMNAGTNERIDSDASSTIESGFATILYTTGRAGESNHTLDFGFVTKTIPVVVPPTYRIGNYVWEDSNNNGIQEAGESGIKDITVTLYPTSDCTGVVHTTTQTANNGSYLFNGLEAGSYCIAFSNLPLNYVPTKQNITGSTPQNNSDANSDAKIPSIEVTTHNLNLDMGLVLVESNKASIGNFVWWDNNVNGVQDVNESGVANVTVQLLQLCETDTPTQVATQQTDENGSYLFTDLDGGNYCLEFSSLPNLTNITVQDTVLTTDSNDSDVSASTGRTETTQLVAGENDLSWDMGIYYPPLVIATPTPTPTPSPVVTPIGDGDDSYEDNNPTPTPVVTPQPVATVTPTAQPTPVASATPTPTNTPTPMVTPTPTILPTVTPVPVIPETYLLGDKVWNDSNRDGIQDSNEVGVPDINVTLYGTNDCTGDVLETTKTDSKGVYQFINLEAGSYCVAFTNLPSNHTITTNTGADDSNNSDANSAGKILNINLVENDLNEDMGIYSQVICEVAKVNNYNVPSNTEGATTVIDIFYNDSIALATQTISLVRSKDGEDISTTNFIKSQTLRVEGEGVWEVNGGSIHFTAQNGFDGIPSPVHYIIEQNSSCASILGTENEIEIGEVRLNTPCVCETYETVLSDSIPISNVAMLIMLILTTLGAILFFRGEEFGR